MKEEAAASETMKQNLNKLKEGLAEAGYICDDNIATVLFIAEKLDKPLLIEGPAGVGKTELSRAFSRMSGRELIRLQCYEGLDETKAIYEWNYKKQLLYIQAEKDNLGWESIEGDIFTEPFMLTRPLLRAIVSDNPVTLLIDELDKVDQEFEAMLLELLGDWQITIPETGTIEANHPPLVFITSNRSRELSEALKRRCLYLYMDYPEHEREKKILLKKLPRIEERLADNIVSFIGYLRGQDLSKPPSIAETIDFASAMLLTGVDRVGGRAMELARNILVKNTRDVGILEDLINSDRYREL